MSSVHSEPVFIGLLQPKMRIVNRNGSNSSLFATPKNFGFIFLRIFIFISFCRIAASDFADFGTVPKGTNPTLYEPEDLVIQLDASTFNDTVLCEAQNGRECRGISYVVQFYSDWCGHCRSYAPTYKSLARDLANWNGVLRIAAMNCADPANHMTCRINGVAFYPFLKYYFHNTTQTRNATSIAADFDYENEVPDGVKLRTFTALSEMRDQITKVLLREYVDNHYENWPNFHPLGQVETYGDLWEGVGPTINLMAVLFEKDPSSLVGAQLLLDLSKYRERLATRRCIQNPLIDALHITDFPTFGIFRRGERSPVFIAELRRLLFNEFEQFLHNETVYNSPTRALKQTFASRSRKLNGSEQFCAENPENCKKLYFVSESDMLKTLRIALFSDVDIVGERFTGSNLTTLFAFVDLLAKYFPYSTITVNDEGMQTENFLNASGRARVVFSHMRDFVEDRGLERSISVDEWKAEFVKAEKDQGQPFPTTSDWEHCKGSNPVLRGYTCGLWTVFHALTVSAFKNAEKEAQFHPTSLLYPIRDWIGAFFGCDHCRRHFLKMTTKSLKIDTQARRREDVFLYLWRAHNIVNARLKGRETEDPQFPKYRFPARFLCPECYGTNVDEIGELDEEAVKAFLIRFYSNIKPIYVGNSNNSNNASIAAVVDIEDTQSQNTNSTNEIRATV